MRRGYTLVEMLVAMGLGLALLALLAGVLVPGLRVWMRSRSDSEAQQAVAVVAARVRDEMRSAHPDSVVCLPSPAPALLLLSWKQDDGSPAFSDTGEFFWQKRVALYHDLEEKEIRIHEEVLAPPSVEVDPVKKATFARADEDHVLARGIRRFEVTLQPNTGVVFLTVEGESGERRSVLETSAPPVMKPDPSPSPSPSP